MRARFGTPSVARCSDDVNAPRRYTGRGRDVRIGIGREWPNDVDNDIMTREFLLTLPGTIGLSTADTENSYEKNKNSVSPTA